MGNFVAKPDAWYVLTFAHSGLALTVKGAATGNANVIQDEVAEGTFGGDHQQWCFQEVEAGWYTLCARHSGGALTLGGDPQADRPSVVQREATGGELQQWKLVQRDGAIQLLSRVSGLAVNVRASKTQAGANVHLHGTSNKTCRRLQVERMPIELPEVAPRALRITRDDEPVRLPPIRREPTGGSSRSFSVELWAQPTQGKGDHRTILWLGNAKRGISIHHWERGVWVRGSVRGQFKGLVRIDDVLPGWQWTHLCVSIRKVNVTVGNNDPLAGNLKKRTAYDCTIYVNGEERVTQRVFESDEDRGGGVLEDMFHAPLWTECALGGRHDGSQVFGGKLAELRVWRKALSAEDVAARYRQRARGDEDKLAACYRLDHAPGERILDQSPARRHALVSQGIEFKPFEGLPLSPTLGANEDELGRVRASSRLTRAWLPESAFDDHELPAIHDELDPGGGSVGPVTGDGPEDRVEVSTYEVVLEPLGPGGEPRPGSMVELALSAEQVVIVDGPDGGEPSLETWHPGVRALNVGAGGRVRLRLLAKDLACAPLWVRHEYMHEDVWTIVHPDAHTFDAIRTLDASALLNPSEGRRSPLAEGTSEADAELLLHTVQKLSRPAVPYEQLVGQPSGGTGGIGGFFEDVGDELVDLGRELADAAEGGVEDTGKFLSSSAEVVWKGSVDTAELLVTDAEGLLDEVANAADVVVRTGPDAIVRGIASASQVAIATTNLEEMINVVQIVGKSVIDGAVIYWKIVVEAIEDAMTAMRTMFKRIGAGFDAFIDNLTALFDFDWTDLLAQSDTIYDEILAGIGGLGQSFATMQGEVAGLMDTVATKLSALATNPASQRSVLDLAGIDAPKLPRFDELDLIMDYFERVMSSTKLSLDLPSFGIDLPDIGDVLDEVTGKIPIELLLDGDRILREEGALRTLAAFAGEVWSDISGLFQAVLGAVGEGIEAVGEGIEAVLTMRLQVPWLTKLIEDAILSADGTTRRLNVLRVIALAAAIPQTLGSGLGGQDQGVGALIITYTSVGIVNALMSSLRSVPIGNPKIAGWLAVAHGVTIVTQGILSLIVWLGADEKDKGAWLISTILNCVYGVMTMICGRVEASSGGGPTLRIISGLNDLVLGACWVGFSTLLVVDAYYWSCAWFILGANGLIDVRYPDEAKKPHSVKRDQLQLGAIGVVLNLSLLPLAIGQLSES